MTRQDIITQAKDGLNEFFGTAADASPMGWDSIVTQAANDVAKETNCFFTKVTASLVSGTDEYTPEHLFAIQRVQIDTGSGTLVPLDAITMADYNNWFVSSSLGTPAIPKYYLPLSPAKVRLVANPNYSKSNGLVMEGYGYPSTSWPNLSDTCPLPTDAHKAVVYRSIQLRIAQMPTPINVERGAELGKLYDSEAARNTYEFPSYMSKKR